MTDDPRTREAAIAWAALQDALNGFREQFGPAGTLLDMHDPIRTQMLDHAIGALCELVLLESLGQPATAAKWIERVLADKRTEWRGRLNPGKQKAKDKRRILSQLAAPLYAAGCTVKAKIAAEIWGQISPEQRKLFASPQAIARLLSIIEKEQTAERAAQEAWRAFEETRRSEFHRRGMTTFLDDPDDTL
jgi:hypothetical protein